MVALPLVPGVIKVQFGFTLQGVSSARSSLYVHTTTGSVTNAQLNAYATAVRTAWATNMAATMSLLFSVHQVECTDLGNNVTPPGIDLTNVPGTLGGGIMTSETCMLLNFGIARRYRGGHPRIYLPLGTATSLNDAQHWTTAFVTTVGTKWQAFITAILGAISGGPVIDSQVNVSYHTGGALRTTPLVDTVLATTVNAIPGSQRRRMGR